MSAYSLSARIARVRPTAIEANVRRLADRAGDAALCAVVKADGYGHGAVTAARAALAGGASWLAVATIPEALEVATVADSVGSDAPVLILAETAPGLASGECSNRVRFTVASVAGVWTLAAAPGPAPAVHLKVDTGMHRMGAGPDELEAMVEALREAGSRLRLEGAWTHFAVADAPNDPFTAEQLRRFDAGMDRLRANGLRVDVVHAANSAGLLAHPDAHRDMVRAGIAIYGVPPSPELEGAIELEPALELVSRVTALRTVAPGESVSYGRHWWANEPTRVATVAIGYADGIRRDSGSAGVEVLVRGHRCSIVGAVTMDQLMVGLPPAIADEAILGDEVVLIGRQGSDEITRHRGGRAARHHRLRGPDRDLSPSAPSGCVGSGVSVDLLIPGVEIGHWTDPVARTGCTVIVLPPGTTASGEVRGGAPATRDFALLAPERLVDCVDAVVLTGGSAFGLAAADGVMEVLEAEGRGFDTRHGPVPIVVAMALYDLGVGGPGGPPRFCRGQACSNEPVRQVGARRGWSRHWCHGVEMAGCRECRTGRAGHRFRAPGRTGRQRRCGPQRGGQPPARVAAHIRAGRSRNVRAVGGSGEPARQHDPVRRRHQRGADQARLLLGGPRRPRRAGARLGARPTPAPTAMQWWSRPRGE